MKNKILIMIAKLIFATNLTLLLLINILIMRQVWYLDLISMTELSLCSTLMVILTMRMAWLE